MFTSLVQSLASEWSTYRAGKKVNAKNPVHTLVVRDFPSVLSQWIGGNSQYKIKGSDGQGNLNRTPWIATFNIDVTTTAEKGYYLVFLFNDSLDEMFLELGFGATQFEENYGRGKRFFEEVESAVLKMQTSSSPLLTLLSESTRQRLSIRSTKLDTEGDFKLQAYEKCSIYNLKYSIGNLPSEEIIKEDFLQMLKLYDAMVESLLLPSEEAYVIEKSSTPEVPEKVNFEPFYPLEYRPKDSKRNAQRDVTEKRFSKVADKIGKIAEEYVFKVEKMELRRQGRDDLAQKVIWHRTYVPDRTPGWDITSYTIEGKSKYIEVKATTGKELRNIELTRNEWEKANLPENSDKYEIYLVTSALKDPKIKILKNPAAWVNDGNLELRIESYLLDLRSVNVNKIIKQTD